MRIAITSSPFSPSIKAEADLTSGKVPFCSVVEFENAFTSFWETDAHFLSYCVQDPDTGEQLDNWPRLSKESLSIIRDRGYDVAVNFLSLDWDTQGHRDWRDSEMTFSDFEKLLEFAVSRFPILGNWRCKYPTKAGYRIVYQLDEPLTASDAEKAALGLIDMARECGLDVDRLFDWTRLMRLPAVVRNGSRTWEQDYFDVFMSDAVLRSSAIPRSEIARKENQYADIGDMPDFDMPTPTEAEAYLESYNDRSQLVKTEFYRHAKKMMKGRNPEFDAIFNGGKLCPVGGGGRNTSVFKAAGRLAGMLMRTTEYLTPMHLYSLLWVVVKQFDPFVSRTKGISWDLILWDVCVRIWQKERSQVEAERQAKEREEREDAETLQDAQETAWDWIDSEEYDNAGVLDALTRRGTQKEISVERAVSSIAIAIYRHKNYIMKPDGRYLAKAVENKGLIREIMLRGSEPIIPLTYTNDDGNVKKRRVADIIDSHAITVTRIKKKFMKYGEGGYITGVLSDKPALWFAMDSINPFIEPEFNEDVAEWLDLMDPSGQLSHWLGYAPAVDQGSICALFLIGPKGSGKDMIVRGLSEVFTNREIATSSALTSQFNPKLEHTCVLWINEAIQGKKAAFNDVDAQFRDLVTSGMITINEKFEPLMDVYNSPRIIGTANNPRMISEMFPAHHSEVSDRDAILERMMYVSTGDKAGRYLMRRGGMNFTAAKGARWVTGKNGQKSDFLLAKHILWLYHNREYKEDIPEGNARLLVEGSGMDNTKRMLQLNNMIMSHSDTKSAVSEALLHLFHSHYSADRDRPGSKALLCRDTMRFWVTAKGVQDVLTTSQFRERYQKVQGIHTIAANLKQIAVSDSPKSSIMLKKRQSLGQLQWICIDLNQLLSFAEEIGETTADLGAFVEDAKYLNMDIEQSMDLSK